MADEAVRTELARLQKTTGLTLASFYRSIETVVFADRSISQGKELLHAGAAGGGAISRDGTKIAVDLWRLQNGASLGIVQKDGTDLREYPEIAAPSEICWSYDESKLAMTVQKKTGNTADWNLEILDLSSRDVQVVDVRAYITSQCLSPDGKKIAYEADDSVRVYDIEQKKWLVLGKGKRATWSPDGNWIAFLDGDTYYVISPSGENRKELFKSKGALSGLWWSPDSRIVAYASRNRTFERPLIAVDVGWVRLRVRRLSDNTEDWVAQLSDVNIPNYQWVKFPALADR